jgi:hypothetical protein
VGLVALAAQHLNAYGVYILSSVIGGDITRVRDVGIVESLATADGAQMIIS